MRKILASALVIGCFVLASYVYVNINRDDSSITKSPPEKSIGNKVAGVVKPSKVTTADPVPAVPTDTSNTKVNKKWSMSEFSVLYKNLDQLVERADYVIEGEIIDVSYFDYNSGTNTKLLVKVKKSYSPEIKTGELLTFSESGGITTQANVIRSHGDGPEVRPTTEAEENTKVIQLFDGRPLTKVGETYVYFAVEIPDGSGWDPIPGADYRAIGGYQGQFKIQNAEAERYDPEDGPGDKYSSLKMKKTDFDKELIKALKNKQQK